jgi:hypothetical protein
MNDEVFDRFRWQKIDVRFFPEKSEFPARPVRVHQVDVLVAADAEQTKALMLENFINEIKA